MATEPHPALAHLCPFCGAQPQEPCRTDRGKGHELDDPHSRRIRLAYPLEKLNVPAKPDRQALCCECGNLRTVSGNYWFAQSDPNKPCAFPFDPRGWCNTGTLLCTNCGSRTRHAVLNGADDRYRDYTEQEQRYILGGEWEGKWPPDREALRSRYFAQFPRNPKLSHRFFLSEADKRREAGETHMPALCGATAEIPRSWSNKKREPGELVKPDRIDWNTEFEDTETGLWWVDMDCVDCLRISNELKRQQRRERIQQVIDWYTKAIPLLNYAEIEALLDFLEPASESTFERWQKTKRGRKDATASDGT